MALRKLTARGSLNTSYWSTLSMTSPETVDKPLVADFKIGFINGCEKRIVNIGKASLQASTYFESGEDEDLKKKKLSIQGADERL